MTSKSGGRVRKSPPRPALELKYILPSFVSGLLLVLSLPKPDFYPLAWIAVVPLLYSLYVQTNVKDALLSSYVAGFVFFAGTFYWIGETMMIYGGLSVPLAVGVAALFAAVYAFYFVLFGVVQHYFIRRFGRRGLLLAPPLWVSVELLRTHLFTGFPWMLSGYALVPYEGLLQIVTWTGVFGLSFIATAVNAALVYGFAHRSKAWLGATVAVIMVFHVFPIVGEIPAQAPVAVRLVQTNISIDHPWRQPADDDLLAELEILSTREDAKPELVVWPETPAPFYLSDDANFRRRMQGMARKLGAYFVIGHIDTIGRNPSNSAAMLGPDGSVISRYDKMHLVPFGEYVPLKPLLFWAESLTRQVGDFTPGSEYTISRVGDHRVSTAICYESIFPDLVRQFAKRGAELIVVITNDGWFGESSAPFQHLRMGVVRAVENRRYMVRTANTGISAIIDPYGRIVARTPIGERMVLDGTAHFRSDLTFYTQYGDVFAYANALFVAGALALLFKPASGMKRTVRGQMAL